MQIESKIELIPVSEIVPYFQNTKKHPDSQVTKIISSIREYGFNVPLVLDENKEIICGHGRYLAAKELDLEEVPCILKNNLTPAQVRAFRIADNKLNESEWDYDFLKLEFEDLKAEDFDLGLTGFENTEIFNLPTSDSFSSKNKEIDVDIFSEKVTLKIELSETDFHEARDILNGISENFGTALMEVLRGRKI